MSTTLWPPPADYDFGDYVKPPPPRPPEWLSLHDNVRNILHLPNGLTVYDIRVPRTDWFGRLFWLEKWETRITETGR